MAELPPIEAAEYKLLHGLPGMVGALAVPELVVPYQTSKPRKRLPADAYELFTIKGIVSDLPMADRLDSLAPSDYSYVITPVPHNISTACLATRDAIGIGAGGELIGFAAAGISHTTRSIFIKQIQGTYSNAASETAKRARHGIRWSETLVKAWAAIGAGLGLETVEIQMRDGLPGATAQQGARVRRMIERHHQAAEYLSFTPVSNDRWQQSIANLSARG
ncbi:MAG TPA: hypothetical protein VLF62_06175 [Candidatus Saccharimonadales bacterium]|nr:hypothetical protein [Candidatus Saccharimonadales bacterium]